MSLEKKHTTLTLELFSIEETVPLQLIDAFISVSTTDQFLFRPLVQGWWQISQTQIP